MICGAIVLGARPSFAAPIAARVAAVKGDVRGSNNEPLQAGSSLRAGTGISSGADSGVLIRPKAGVDVLASMDTKISFNGAELDSKGSGTAGFTVLSGSVLVRIDEDSGDTQAAGKVNVSITTKLGVISTTNGTFSVREDKTGTIIAVSAGTPVIRISGGADGGQVEIPKGSVLWLEKKEDGTVETKIVNSATGTMVVIKPDGTLDTSQKAPAALLAEASGYLQSNDAPTTTDLITSASGSNGLTMPTTNPDLSSPKVVLPVVSSDTP